MKDLPHIVTTRSIGPSNLSVAISASRYIRFICDTCKVCKADQFMEEDSMFYDQVKPGDEVLADKAFQMNEYLLLHYVPFAMAPAVKKKS